MFTIAQAADRTGVSVHTLRYYERIGLLDTVQRNTSGHRIFDSDDLGRIEFLTMLRATGMPIAGMQRFVELTRAGDDTIEDRIALLEQHQQAVTHTIRELREHNKVIEHKLEIYQRLRNHPMGGRATALRRRR